MVETCGAGPQVELTPEAPPTGSLRGGFAGPLVKANDTVQVGLEAMHPAAAGDRAAPTCLGASSAFEVSSRSVVLGNYGHAGDGNMSFGRAGVGLVAALLMKIVAGVLHLAWDMAHVRCLRVCLLEWEMLQRERRRRRSSWRFFKGVSGS